MGWAEGADRKGIVAAGWRGPVRFCQTPDLTLCPLDGGHDARTDRHVWTIDGKTVFTAFVDVPGIDALAAGILRGAGGVRGSLGCLRAPARLRHGRLSFSVHAA